MVWFGELSASSLWDLANQPALERWKHGFLWLPLSRDLRYLRENKGARTKSDRLLGPLFPAGKPRMARCLPPFLPAEDGQEGGGSCGVLIIRHKYRALRINLGLPRRVFPSGEWLRFS